ncbi:MAG: hypothetical protein KDD50_08100 [Bdellovibrionales bacterium]|nr:hypothetical protein [Bdellovibrionales bacterium]
MDTENLRSILIQLTKSLTVHDIEIVDYVQESSVHFRIIAEGYASQEKAKRVITVLNLINAGRPDLSKNMLISIDPLTPEEFRNFYDSSDSTSSGVSSGTGQAAKPAEA